MCLGNDAYGDLGLGLNRYRLTEDVERRVDLKALHALIVGGIDRTPQWLRDRSVLLHDPLKFAQDFAARVDIESAFRLRQQLVELLIGVSGLVPRHAGAIG